VGGDLLLLCLRANRNSFRARSRILESYNDRGICCVGAGFPNRRRAETFSQMLKLLSFSAKVCLTCLSQFNESAAAMSFRMVVRLLNVSVLVRNSHERADFYGRFTGGFAKRACSQRHPRQPVCCMRILQRPYLEGFRLSC